VVGCLDGPVASVTSGREDERELAELEVWSDALALDKHARVDLGHKRLEVGVLSKAWVELSLLASLTDVAASRAHADAADWRTSWQ